VRITYSATRPGIVIFPPCPALLETAHVVMIHWEFLCYRLSHCSPYWFYIVTVT